jgi:hypothetical protein
MADERSMFKLILKKTKKLLEHKRRSENSKHGNNADGNDQSQCGIHHNIIAHPNKGKESCQIIEQGSDHRDRNDHGNEQDKTLYKVF